MSNGSTRDIYSKTPTVTSVPSATESTFLLAENVYRKQAMFYNDSTQALYLKCGIDATSASFSVKIASYGYYELPPDVYTGDVYGAWAAANGSVKVTEVSG